MLTSARGSLVMVAAEERQNTRTGLAMSGCLLGDAETQFPPLACKQGLVDAELECQAHHMRGQGARNLACRPVELDVGMVRSIGGPPGGCKAHVDTTTPCGSQTLPRLRGGRHA